jgi:tetratricopeptide (TPR) repeat protein
LTEAIKSFDQVTSINEQYIHAWFYKSVCYSRNGQKEMADKCLDKVIELEPNFELLNVYHFLVHPNVNTNRTSNSIKIHLIDPSQPKFSKYYYPKPPNQEENPS